MQQAKQSPPPGEDSRCTHIFPAEHLKAGEQCTGPKVRGTDVCIFHTEGSAARTTEIRKRYADYYKSLEDKLVFWDKPLNSMIEVNTLTQEVTRGVLAGILKKDKAMYLIGLIDQLWKQSKELEGTGRLQQSHVTNIDNSRTLIVNMEPEQIDKYLLADNQAKVQILEELEKKNKIKITKRKPDVIEAEIKGPAKNLFEKMMKSPPKPEEEQSEPPKS